MTELKEINNAFGFTPSQVLVTLEPEKGAKHAFKFGTVYTCNLCAAKLGIAHTAEGSNLHAILAAHAEQHLTPDQALIVLKFKQAALDEQDQAAKKRKARKAEALRDEMLPRWARSPALRYVAEDSAIPEDS